MRTVRTWITLFLPIALAAGGCAERKQAKIVAPEPPGGDPPAIAEAHWIWDRGALGAAVTQASSSPLVQRALNDAPGESLPLFADGVVRAEGTLSNGADASVTILPYASPGDATHATFVSLIRRGDDALAERSELITGRSPLANETGFEPVRVGSQILWVKCEAAYGPGLEGGAALSPERINWSKFMKCFTSRAPLFSDAGATIATQVAPAWPAAAAVGGAAGTAIAALACGVSAWE